MSRKAAILYFALSPDRVAKSKKWTPSKRKNSSIASALDVHMKSILESVEVDKLFMDERYQKDSSFEENISHCIELAFNFGYDDLIIVGNDCPEITKKDITTSIENLKNQIHTVGKTEDGGVYLFTLNKENWSKDQFINLPWCTDLLSNELVQYFNNSDLTFLKIKKDLDFLRDIEEYINKCCSVFSKRLKQLLSCLALRISYLYFSSHLEVMFVNRRGPPVL